MKLLKLNYITFKPFYKNYSTNNRSTTENYLYFPYRFKVDFFLSYEQFKHQYTSFLRDLYSRKLSGNDYLLVIYENNVVITTDKLASIKSSLDMVQFILNKCSNSSIIKFELMHCFT
jgi:hypothetical protein